jgi:transcriptional regulator with PAS, ATPase and Fis domain
MKEIESGSFRRDLFYRLNVLPIPIPPLRERKEDIPLLISYFIDRRNKQLDRDVQGIDRKSMELARRYPWPGNVRELENLVERAMLLYPGPHLKLTPQLFPVMDTATPDGERNGPEGSSFLQGDYYQSVEAFKRWVIQDAIRRAGGSKKEAAQLLGMAPSYMSRLLKNLEV